MACDIYREAGHRAGIHAEIKAFPIKRGIAMMFDHTVAVHLSQGMR